MMISGAVLPFRVPLLVHATHEAGVKVGGIGAVLDGLLRSTTYQSAVGRTILAGPLNAQDPVEMERLTAQANRLTILYSSIHGINQAPPPLAEGLRVIESRMQVRLVYGRRAFGHSDHEVILVDAQSIAVPLLNSLKRRIWDTWGLPSDRYESNKEYDFHLSAAQPLYAALEVITSGMAQGMPRYLIAHEWLGMPMVFCALLHDRERYKTVFYAHEVATARLLVENDKGHDTRFYNVLRAGLASGHSLDDVFGDQSWYYKQAVIRRASICDRIFAVGDLVVDELRFLAADFRSAKIDLVYNGVTAEHVTLAQRQHSRDLLQRYVENLLGFRPDYVFTHVGRMVLSKALWRDMRVLEHLDPLLAAGGRRAVLFVVSSAEPSGRLPADVYRWEQTYGWPVEHRPANGDQHGDLHGEEASFYLDTLAPFNARSRTTQAVLVNQFGWSRERDGARMPAEMTFADLRAGSDVEFGQSIYEPFGIAQVEPLGAGALSVVTSVCGCVGFVQRATAGHAFANLVVADYTALPRNWLVRSPWDALWISGRVREEIEARNSPDIAQQIMDRLPRNEADRHRLLEAGQDAAKGMSWDVVVAEYLLPALAALG